MLSDLAEKLPRPRVVSERRNHEKMAEMVRLLCERGPRIDEIARLIGVYNETVRYWYKRLRDRGFTIQAACNYERLGMKRLVATVELGELLKDCPDAVFSPLGELGYVIGYAKVRSEQLYILNVSVPQECLGAWTDFMLGLRQMGAFKSVETVMFDWVHNVPMRAEYFDFERGEWKFDWNRVGAPTQIATTGFDERKDYDSIDLKIIEQLQIDASASLTEMCRKTGIKKYESFSWHYRQHVVGRGLVRGYRANWTGMRFDSEITESAGTLYRFAWVDVIADDLSVGESNELRLALSNTPFVWMEGIGTRSFYARLVLPSLQLSDSLRTLRRMASSMSKRVKWLVLDQTHALSFSLPSQFYDDQNQRWTFRKEEVLQRFETLLRVRHEIIYGHLPPGRKEVRSNGLR